MGRSQVIKSLILSWLGTVFIIAGIVVMVTVSLAGFWLFLFAIGFSIWRLTQMGLSAESDCEAGITTFLGILFIVILPFDALILTSRLISRRYGDVGM